MTEQEIAAASNCFTCMSPEQLQAAQVYLLEQIRIGGGAAWPYVLRAGDTMTGPLSFSGTTNPGLRLSNLTTTERDAIVSPAAGMAIWNTTLTRLNIYNGSAWTNGYVKLDGDTMTGPLVNSTNGAVNASVFKLTGTPVEDTTPFAVIGPTPTGDVLGCMLAVNCPNGFGGNVLDIFADGTSAFKVTGNGTVAVFAGLTLGYSSSTSLISEATDTLALRRTTNAQTIRMYRTYTNSSNYARLRLGWNSTTGLVMAEGQGTGSDGSIAFNDAALATNATVGFIMIPSCAGAPTGVPSNIPTGQIPVAYDSTNNKIYAYNGSWRSVTLT